LSRRKRFWDLFSGPFSFITDKILLLHDKNNLKDVLNNTITYGTVYCTIYDRIIHNYIMLQNTKDIDRIIEMAWEDRTPFEAIKFQFGLSESDVIKLMRKTLKTGSFKCWRKRVNSGLSSKHLKKRSDQIKRFKSNQQRTITGNKISKRK